MAKKEERILTDLSDFFTRQFKDAMFVQEEGKPEWNAKPSDSKTLCILLLTTYNEKYKHNDHFLVVSMNGEEKKRLQIRNELPHSPLSKLLSSLILGRGVPGKKAVGEVKGLSGPSLIVDRRGRCEECGKQFPDEELTIDTTTRIMARTVCESCLKKIEGKK